MKTKKERAEYIGRKLDELYPEVPIPLDHTDAFTLLIAVLLSAQCTDKRVNIVTPALFAKASTPQNMMKLSVEEILECIKTCGLANSKAKNIRAVRNSGNPLVDSQTRRQMLHIGFWDTGLQRQLHARQIVGSFGLRVPLALAIPQLANRFLEQLSVERHADFMDMAALGRAQQVASAANLQVTHGDAET